MWSTRVSHKMSDHLEYLEGDVEDFEDIEGDVDLSEWASMGDDGTALNVKHSGKDFGVATGKHKPQTSQNNNARQSSVTQGNQSSIPKQPGTSPSVREAQKSGTSPSVRGAQKSGIQSKTYTSQTSGNAGYSDIAGAIQSSGPHAPLSVGKFSQSSSDREQESKAQPKNQQNVAGMKRKTDSNLDQEKEGAKQRRVESDSDILMVIEDDGSKGDAGSVTVEDRDRIEKKSSLTQEEMRQLDASLVDEMMDGIKRQMFLRLDRGDRYVVTFGPLELADLAHSSVQQLIESEPNLAFFFKRQGKFKKKKGYAQVYFHLTSEVRQFIEMLMYVKLSETRTDVSIAALMNTGKQTAQVSFVLSSNNSSKLMDLLKKEDPSRPSPLATKANFQVEKVSTETTSTLLILLFPFASSISFNYDQSKDVGPGYKGPVNVFYLNQRWMDAVLACCSDFKFNDLTLNLLLPGQQQQQSVPKAPPQRRASRTDGASCSTNVDKPSTAEDKPSTSSQEDNTSGNRSRHVSSGSAKSGSEGADDDISNMTLDVCAGMMESLDKLKQMGTDNPDVLKILEMQSQLSQLQKSLTKKTKQAPAQGSADPWKVSPSEATESRKDKSGGKAPGRQPSWEEKKKQKAMERKERARTEDEILAEKLREAEERDREKEARLREEIEIGKQKLKEIEEKKKAHLAKQMVKEARDKGVQGGDISEAAHKILRTMAEKREAQKLEKELTPLPHKVVETQVKLELEEREAVETQVKLEIEERDHSKNKRHVNPCVNRGRREALSKPENAAIKEESSSEDWNPSRVQELGTMSFQDKFQPMTSFLGGFPGSDISTKAPGQAGSNHGSGGGKGGASSGTNSGRPSIAGQPPKRNSAQADDGLHSRLEEFEMELAQKGVVAPLKPHKIGKSQDPSLSPDRPLHEGAPVYTEKEYHLRRKTDGGRGLPADFYIQTTFLPNRKCPVQACPASKVFRTEPMFLDHWAMFHTPTVTMRFCRRCTAYFLHGSELHAHLVKAHRITDISLANGMVAEARVKVVSNPSYRDPGRFLAPPV